MEDTLALVYQVPENYFTSIEGLIHKNLGALLTVILVKT